NTGQDHPCESSPAEGNPVEGRPRRKSTPTGAGLLPESEDEAIARAGRVGVPADFARLEYLSKSAEGWRSGYGNLITHWENHIQARWSHAQAKSKRVRAARASTRLYGDEDGLRPAPGVEPTDFTKFM